ncbi:MAG: TrkH family potassium uptake protein [Muribaculaceae bacterium]|nr:TrkH family potassium uptake protein [Muribaculaceae bacterium]
MSGHIRKRKHLLNLRQLGRIMGWLLIIEAGFLLIPTLTAAFYHESDWLPFAATTVLTGLTGLLLSRYIRPQSHHMGKRDGFLLTASVWVVFSFFGLIPFLFCTHNLGYTDAFFEAMSGFTTTGASAIKEPSAMSHGIHMWRAMMQWIGGMGIILFTLAVIPMLNHSGGIQMFNAEVTGITHDKIRPRINQTAKQLWLIYISLTIILILLLWLGPMSFFESVCHAFGTISTGGYSTDTAGITAWDSSVYVKLVVIVFMFFGGVNFSLVYRALRGDFAALRRNDVLKTYLCIIGVATALFIVAIIAGGSGRNWMQYSIDPLFQVVSTLTSTGYVVAGFSSWGAFVLGIALVMMFFGACAGSTSGGAKIDRIIFLFKNIRNEVERTIFPNSIRSVSINGRVANSELVTKVIAFLCLYVLIIIAGGIVIAAMGVPLGEAFFSAFSCISNTGFSTEVRGWGGGFDLLPDAAKWVLALLMLIGRLEIFTVLVLFTPAFWRR